MTRTASRLIRIGAVALAALGAVACEDTDAASADGMAAAGMAGTQAGAPPGAPPGGGAGSDTPGGPGGPGALAAGKLDQKVVTVGDTVLTRGELNRAVGNLLQSVGIPPDQVTPEMVRMVEARAYEQMITRELLRQEAQARGFMATPEDVEQQVQRFRQGLPPGITFDVWLRRMGLTDEAFRAELATNVAMKRLEDDVRKQARDPTEAELKKIYQDEKERFAAVKKASAHHILVALPPDAPADQVQAAQDRAAALSRELKGKDKAAFEKAAREKSEDPRTRDKGGDMGTFEPRQVLPGFWMAMDTLKPGEVSDPVRTDRGFHVIRSGGIKKEADRPFAEVKPAIAAYEKARREAAAVAALVEEKRKTATIDRHYLPPPPPERAALVGEPPPGLPPGGLPPGGLPPGGLAGPPGMAPGGGHAGGMGAHGLPGLEIPSEGLPLPSADNVLPGVRNPHAAGGGHGGAAPPPSADQLRLDGQPGAPPPPPPGENLKLPPANP